MTVTKNVNFIRPDITFLGHVACECYTYQDKQPRTTN